MSTAAVASSNIKILELRNSARAKQINCRCPTLKKQNTGFSNKGILLVCKVTDQTFGIAKIYFGTFLLNDKILTQVQNKTATIGTAKIDLN